MKKSSLVMILALVGCQQALSQGLPKEKKIPIYRIHLECPRGQKVWIKQEVESTQPKEFAGTNVIQMNYWWFLYDEQAAMRPLVYWGNEEKRCFKNDPNPLTNGGKP